MKTQNQDYKKVKNILFTFLLIIDFLLFALPYLQLIIDQISIAAGAESIGKPWENTLALAFGSCFLVVFIFNLIEFFFPKVKWYWLVLGYVIFPISIPYVIFKQKSEKNNDSTLNETYSKKDKQRGLFIAISVINLTMLLLFFTSLGIWIVFAKMGGTLLNVVLPALILDIIWLIGAIFFFINYFIENKWFKVLSWLGFPFNWFYLVWELMENRDIKNNDSDVSQNLIV